MLTDKFKKTRGPELDESTASQMLENIFDACEVEPNTVPLSVLKRAFFAPEGSAGNYSVIFLYGAFAVHRT